MKNVVIIRLVLILTLISNILSYGMMFGSYSKGNFANRDTRFSKAYTLVNRNIIEKHGGSQNAEVFPIATYHQIVNGLNYKIITAVRDEKNKKVNFVYSVVYTGPFAEQVEPTLTSFEKIPNVFNIDNEDEIKMIENYIQKPYEKSNANFISIESMVRVPNVVNEESFYLVNVYVEILGGIVNRYYVISSDSKKGLQTMHTYDFGIK